MSVAELFRHRRAVKTLLLWFIFFMSLLDVFILTTWLPTQIAALGFSVTVAILVGTALQVGAVIGIVLGWGLDRIGGGKTLAIAYAIAAISVVGIALAGGSLPLIVLGALGAGFGVIGGQVAANAVASGVYPTEIRSTGVGYALGVGRIGSIIGPAVAGVLIGMNVSPRDIFLLAAIPPLLAALAALALGWAGRAEMAGAAATPAL
jgi:AAHS family 4-hydroxybenzoate transporter-like MFS transporter